MLFRQYLYPYKVNKPYRQDIPAAFVQDNFRIC